MSEDKSVSRRDFIKVASAAVIGVGLGTVTGRGKAAGANMADLAPAEKYLLVDSEKCAGCTTCMTACSLAHEGKASPSLSRIQIIRHPLTKGPLDLATTQCRQCTFPTCLEACPTGALHADAKNHVDKHAQKCDFCADTPHWDGDGPACAALCPMKAIKVTTEVPIQMGKAGYDVNLRTTAFGAHSFK